MKNEYEKRTANNLKDVKVKLKIIAKELGEGWTPANDPYEHGGSISGPNGAGLYIRLNGWPVGKGCASGNYPRNEDNSSMSAKDWIWNDTPINEIGFSSKKDPVKIAKDIKKRLLPYYLRGLKIAQDKLIIKTDDKNNREGVIERLASMLNEKPNSNDLKTFSFYDADDDSDDSISLYGKVSYDGSVSLDIRDLDEKLASKIIKLIKKERNIS